MSSKHIYIVPILNKRFDSLANAKWDVKIGFLRHEAIRYLQNEVINHYIGDKLHSETPIKVDELGNITFGKTRKVI